MSRPFVCAACRARQLVPKSSPTVLNRSLRKLSQTTSSKRERVPSISDGNNETPASSSNPRAPPITRGRYSTQELNPHEILRQLDGRRRARESTASPLPRPRQPAVDSPVLVGSEQHPSGDGQAERAVTDRYHAFIRLVQGKDLAGAWAQLVALGDLMDQGVYLKQAGGAAGEALRTEFMACTHTFLWDFIQAWLEALASNAVWDLPRPFGVCGVLLRLGPLRAYGSGWRTALWRMAIGAHRFRHLDVRPAAQHACIKQLAGLWRFCIAVRYRRDLARAANAEDASDSSPRRTESRIDVPDTWNFLPPPSRYDNWHRAQGFGDDKSFEAILGTMLPHAANPGFQRFDYGSSALVTLDVLRHTVASNPSGTNGSDVSHFVEVANCAPFVRLMEHMVSLTSPIQTPRALKGLLTTTEDPEALEQVKAMCVRLNLRVPPIKRNSQNRIFNEGLAGGLSHSTPHAAAVGTNAGATHDVELPQNGRTDISDAAVSMGGDNAPDENPASSISPVQTSKSLNATINLDSESESNASKSTAEDGSKVEEETSPDESEHMGELSSEEVTEIIGEPSEDPQVRHFATTSVKQLVKAAHHQDLYAAERVKRAVFAFAASNESAPCLLPLGLYEHLMRSLLLLRSPAAAIEVWNHVVKSGYKLTVKTFTVMMSGAQASRDFTGMEAFWERMRRAGFQPDEHAWSTRIYGHLRLKRLKSGLQLLSDMGNEWLAAARADFLQSQPRGKKGQKALHNPTTLVLLNKYPGSVGGVPRPNQAIVNSAIVGLTLGAEAEIPKVLSWGRSFGIEPDRTTYNALLNISLRRGKEDDAIHIVEQMQAKGLIADGDTWTVILSSMFKTGFLERMSHSEQQTKILAFLDSTQGTKDSKAGVDEKGYALIMNHLLKHHQNPSAAVRVLSHMEKRGLTPTSHIYTILVTHFFQENPPNFTAIETLWRQVRSNNTVVGGVLDSVFYDRMIEGYATHHDRMGYRPALEFLDRMLEQGKKPGWRALEVLARALVAHNQIEHLRVLVDDTRVRLRTAKGGTQHTGQVSFWEYIISTGLLRDEGIRRARDLTEIDLRQRRSPMLMAEG